MSPTKPVCGFCKGLPVQDAASWLDDKPRPPLPCPRCGRTNHPADVVKEIAEENPYVPSSLEEHREFVADYERVHGEGSWEKTRDGGEFT